MPMFSLKDLDVTGYDTSKIIDELIISGLGKHIIPWNHPKNNILIPYHFHENEEYNIVLKGHLRFNIEEILVDLYPGQILMVMKNTLHSFTVIEPNTMTLVGF